VESHAGNDPDYVVGTDGRITFSPAGRAFYTAYFGYAGIDIRAIRTLADFERAGRAAFPFLFAFMGEHLRKGAQTLETRVLLAIVEGDAAGLARIDRQLATRKRLTLIRGARDAPPARR
jgi:hypothetical protein